MKTRSGIMSQPTREEYLKNARQRYLKRNRVGRSAMIDEVSETLGWERKHTIKTLNGKVALGMKAERRGSKATHGEEEHFINVCIWKQSEQPCGVRLKATLPLWMESYQAHYGVIEEVVAERILSYNARTLERITFTHRVRGEGRRKGRRSGRASNRIKTFVPIRCGPQEFDEPGWMEAARPPTQEAVAAGISFGA